MEVHTELIVVLLACDALLLGALMRLSARGTKIPYTVTMLLLGFGLGLGVHLLQQRGSLPEALAALEWGAYISPQTILLVFLPALVFESAFALDAHSFRRDLGAVGLLAVPALLVSVIATAALMVPLTSFTWNWSWTAGLVFGALISATDPVAVVAILRETSAPKRLGLLIEGESLLNDGTSIVVFTVFFGVLTAGGLGEIDTTGTVLRFFWVVAGGIVLGLTIAAVGAYLVGRTFNDPLVEITVTLVIAYLSMVVAEEFLEVSGVLAVVSAGLFMSSRGRTRISPEVLRFLHQFWEMLAYIANTLIFFVVGLVIAAQAEHAHASDLGLILFAYLGVVVLRFGVTFLFRPLLGKVSQPVSTNEATVISWGGLRGAVSLALALMVARSDSVDAELGQQILLVTAGVVLLTILINGSTTGRLLQSLGFSTPPLGERIASLSAGLSVVDATIAEIDRVAGSRSLRTVSWQEVQSDLESRRSALQRQLDAAQRELDSEPPVERDAGYWLQALSIERQAYWIAFGEGTLGAMATTLLTNEIDLHCDRLSMGEFAPPPARTQAFRRTIGRVRKSHGGFGAVDFDRLTLLYDLARGQTLGAERVLAGLDQLQGIGAEHLERIRETYRAYARTGIEELEDLRSNLPEVARAIETQLARRIQLNFERERYERLAQAGVLDTAACEMALERIERDMKLLRTRPKKVELPETAVVCRNAPLFRSLDETALAELADITVEEVLAPRELLFEEGDAGDSLYVIVRGAVQVIRTLDGEERVVDVLGGGEVVGEMALLSGEPRSATIKAATTVTVGRVDRQAFERLMEQHEDVRRKIWHSHCAHQLDNYLTSQPRYRHLTHAQRVAWIANRPVVTCNAGETLEPEGLLFVARGVVELDDMELRGPALVDTQGTGPALTRTDVLWVSLPRTPPERVDESEDSA